MLAWLLSLGLAQADADPRIRVCIDPAGRRVYQDQPCMGRMRKPGVEAVPVGATWRWSKRGCRLRSPLLQVRVTPPELPSAQQDLPAVPVFGPPEPSAFDQDNDPGTLGLWLELQGSTDGVAVWIRGFQPLPITPVSFDTDLSGQGIRVHSGELIAPDSLEGPTALRYGHHRSRTLIRSLQGDAATLDIRLPGWQAQPLGLDAQSLRDAVKRVQACVENPAHRLVSPGPVQGA